jgi:hypothetical protein
MMQYAYMRKSSGKVRKVRRWAWGGLAAVVVLLIGVGLTIGILVSNNKNSASNQLSESSSAVDNNNNPPKAEVTFVRDASSSPIAVPNAATAVPTVGIVGVVNNTEVLVPVPVPVPAPVPIVSDVAPTSSGPTTSSPTYLNEPTTTVFYAHADIPYKDEQTIVLEEQMRSVRSDAEFVVFLGDLREAGDDKPCLAEEYASAAYYFSLSHAPVFVIQGDNDISDCPNYEEGKALWMKEFVGFESKHWNHTFQLQRQEGYPDNFAFVHKFTLFIGLNIIGGETRNATEWETRLSDELTWTTDLIRTYQSEYSNATNVGRIVIFGHANPGPRHATFFQTFSSFIKYELMDSVPIVYINGDKHEWLYNTSFYDNPSWLRIGVTGLGAEPLLRVTVEADGTDLPPKTAFALERFI